MGNPEHAELIARVLDGESTDQERTVLDDLLASDASVRHLYDDLAATDAALSRLALVPPSPDLTSRIMSALPTDLYARPVRQRRVPRLEAIRDALSEFLRVRPAYAFAYALVLGAAVGVGAFATLADRTGQPGASDAFATMISHEFPSGLHVIDEHEVATGGVAGTTRLLAGDGLAYVELTLTASVETEVSVTFDPDEIRWGGLTRLSEPAASALVAGDGRVLLAFPEAVHYLLSFDTGDVAPRVTLAISEEGTERARHTLSGSAR